ncbi:MAG: TadE/TadG family type IV pilus assembly protein [Planctomycetota bacterium]
MRGKPPDHHAVRGSAAVEFLLSVPFLVLFCLFMMDFARGYISAQRGQRAARHLAWATSRLEEDGASPPAPNAEALHAIHFQGRGGPVSAATSTEYGGLLYASGADDDIDAVLSLFDLGRRFVAFLTGTVDMTHATVTQQVTGLQWFIEGTAMTQEHWVALRSYREEDPARRVGWWDPFAALSDAIDELGGD